MHSLMRRAWVDVDLGALLRNGTALAARANVPLLPMVKADATALVRNVFRERSNVSTRGVSVSPR